MPINSPDSFAQARKEKREVFQTYWNQFIQKPLSYVLLGLFLAAQVLFFISSIDYIRQQLLYLTKLKENQAIWYAVAIAAVLSLPGVGFSVGLFRICRKTRWQGESTPDISGVKLIKLTNILLCIVTGITLALYPTIIITAGEYIMEDKLLRLFYLLLPSVVLFALCVSLVRIVIKRAEENITCCWSDTGCLLPLILILLAAAAAALVFGKTLFFISAAALLAAYAAIAIRWWLFLKKTALRHAAIDQNTIARRETPDDPYHRY